MIHEGVNLETGEVIAIKPYETEEHKEIKKEVAQQIAYVHKTLKDDENPGQLARLDGDTLSMVLMELTAYYEYLHSWLANEKLHLSDLKSTYEIKFANEYITLKDRGTTNETARMKAKLACQQEAEDINRYKHGIDVITAWGKSIARYHDSVRSQLSWEKTMGGMSRGQ